MKAVLGEASDLVPPLIMVLSVQSNSRDVLGCPGRHLPYTPAPDHIEFGLNWIIAPPLRVEGGDIHPPPLKIMGFILWLWAGWWKANQVTTPTPPDHPPTPTPPIYLRCKIPFCGPEQWQYAKIHIIVFLIVLYLFRKRTQNWIRKSPWLMLAGLCLQENCSFLGKVAVNWFSFQTSEQCEILFNLTKRAIGKE